MSFATVFTRGSLGIQAPLVIVETHISNGLPKFSIVGLPEAVVKESKDRVRSALINSNFEFPVRHITVNLAPADLPKEGGRFDLAIALSILAASKQIDASMLDKFEFGGELGLAGELRGFFGAIPFAVGTRSASRELIIAKDNAEEAALPGDLTVYAAHSLIDVCAHLQGRLLLSQVSPLITADIPPEYDIDMADVAGQARARRALEIAAAGGHSMLMCGPPGTGKTMLASRLSTLLPLLTIDEALDVAAILSLSNSGLRQTHWKRRPFRAPHHTASAVALVGGGSQPRPGEISLAHHGVLFLDELPEFDRKVLEVLREPLESGSITISRAARSVEFPAKFQLIAAMNPCPCGYATDPNKNCRCTPAQIQRYHSRLSGPLLDRIDLHIEVPCLPKGVLTQDSSSQTPESSAQIRERVCKTRQRQLERASLLNSQLTGKILLSQCRLDSKGAALLEDACQKLGLSARAYHRILRVARTIADLHTEPHITRQHLLEALCYRRADSAMSSVQQSVSAPDFILK